MPHIISRKKAVDKITGSIKPGECLVCRILKSDLKYAIHKGKYTTTVLSEYPRTWGQTMIVLNAHKVAISEITKEEWTEISENTRKTALVIENVLKPLRCYISSLGATENLINTCPHIHFNVLPIYNIQDKPSEIFTWKNGVFQGEESEWKKLWSELDLNFNNQ
jgi:diadenosine tetraphosphate (Ap4A) HIT family hydrolase